MKLNRVSLITASLALLAASAATAAAQDEDCVGDRPRGGRFVTSAELYMDRARKNPDPEDKAKLYREAVEVLQEGWVSQPDNPRNYLMAGQAYAELGDYVAADSAFGQADAMWSCYAAEVDSLRHRAWVNAFNRAVGYAQREDDERALENYEQAWAVYKKLPQPQLQIGTIYAMQAQTAESEEEREALQAKAIEAYRIAISVTPEAERLTDAQRQEYGRVAAFNLAQLLAFEERFEEAAQAYMAFLEQEPGNIDATTNAAVVLTNAAARARGEAAELDEGPEKAKHMAKADSLADAAESLYRELLARDDLTAADYHRIGFGFLQMERYDQASEGFQKALDFEPYRISSLEQLGRVHYFAGNYEELLEVAKTLVERYPLNLDNLALLANAYRETEQSDSALAILERREALSAQLSGLDLEAEEGVYTVAGYLQNFKLEPNTPVEIQFDFYDDLGDVVTSETVTVSAPEQDGQTEFSVSTESASLISGFAYKPVNLEPAPAGT